MLDLMSVRFVSPATSAFQLRDAGKPDEPAAAVPPVPQSPSTAPPLLSAPFALDRSKRDVKALPTMAADANDEGIVGLREEIRASNDAGAAAAAAAARDADAAA